MIEATADGILVVGRDRRIVLANQRFADMVRVPGEVLRAGDDHAVVQAVAGQLADSDVYAARLRELSNAPEAESFDTLLFADGRVFECYSRPQRSGAEVVGRVWSFRDVTDRENARSSLEDSEIRHRSLIEQLSAITYLDDIRNDTSVYMSPQTRSMLGYEAHEVDRLDTWLQMVHPDDRAAYAAEMARCVREGVPFRSVNRMVRRDGSVIWVREEEAILPGPDGQPLYRQGTLVDITAEVEAQAQLRRAEGLYRGLVEQLPGVVYLWAPGGECLYVSPEVEQVFGCSPDAFAQGAWRTCIAVDDLERVRATVAAAHSRGEGARVEYRIRHGVSGEVRWLVEQTAIVATDAYPDVVQGLIVDRTGNVLAEQALQESEAERREERRAGAAALLRAADDERARIATDLHDDTVQVIAASMLTIDRAIASLARGDLAPAGVALKAARSVLAEGLERTRRLTFELRPPVLEASGVAAAVSELADGLVESVGVVTTVDASVGRCPADVEAIAYRTIREALTNVRKHAAAKTVHITMREAGGRLEGSVHDDGCGFELQPDSGRPRLSFGLEMTRERLELAGGTFAITSVPGTGTTLAFSLPLEGAG